MYRWSTEEDYTLLDIVVSRTRKRRRSRKSMVDVIASQKKAVEKAVKAELLKGTPKPEPGNLLSLSLEDGK